MKNVNALINFFFGTFYGQGIVALASALAVVGIGAAWYFGSPLILNVTVDEELPTPVVETPSDPLTEELPIQVISTGMFRDADNFHRGSGTATINNVSGDLVLRFEDFNVTNGPQLHVRLYEGEDPQVHSDLGAYRDLGPLKGNRGNQNYDIPADIDLDRYNSVVIYCVPFSVIFSVAPLSDTPTN